MKTAPNQARTCAVTRAIHVLGDRWTLLIVREALSGTTRFEEFQRNLHIAPNILSARLRKLQDEEIVTRTLYQRRPPRHEYALTEKGREIHAIIAAFAQWGEHWSK